MKVMTIKQVSRSVLILALAIRTPPEILVLNNNFLPTEVLVGGVDVDVDVGKFPPPFDDDAELFD